MKIVAIGDIHGRGSWVNIVEQEHNADLFVFIGDYFDSREIPYKDQKSNFENIIQFKKDNINKVVLLIGNHCRHYMNGVTENDICTSTFQPDNKYEIGGLFKSALQNKLLKVCHIEGGIIFSHAGLTKTWCTDFGIPIGKEWINYCLELINTSIYYNILIFNFKKGKNNSQTGDDVTQGPFWVRPNSLIQDKIDGYRQIVGHTGMRQIFIREDVTFIDTLGTSKEYLVIIDGKMETRKIL